MTLDEAEALLDTYSLEDILYLNDLTEADALVFMEEQSFINLPDIRPIL